MSAKQDLYPFEEAKLYGHNAIHFLLGCLGEVKGKEYMSELRSISEVMEKGRAAFINECGAALCKKWNGADQLFTPAGFQAYAENLLERMTNPFLQDAISRITRDLPRKLSWNDRVIGTIRTVMSQGGDALILREGALLAIADEFGEDEDKAKYGLQALWTGAPEAEQEAVLDFIFKKVK